MSTRQDIFRAVHDAAQQRTHMAEQRITKRIINRRHEIAALEAVIEKIQECGRLLDEIQKRLK
jgi:hypothetical protein